MVYKYPNGIEYKKPVKYLDPISIKNGEILIIETQMV